MRELLKSAFKKTPFYAPYKENQKRESEKAYQQQQQAEVDQWISKGRPVPPPHIIKQRTIADYAKRYALKTLVETGTYQGEMIHCMREHFEELYTIELNEELHQKAKERFARDEHIHPLQGDSKRLLSEVITKLNQPTLFWLDAHYSGVGTSKGDETSPIRGELETIVAMKYPYAILIDDARLFGVEEGYPTIDQTLEVIHELFPDHKVETEDDIIRITQPE